MSTIDIRLPDNLKAFVDEQVSRGGYRDASEFVQSLLEAERSRRVGQELEAMLLEASEGPFEEWGDADMDGIRKIGRHIVERRMPD